jgi:hypothetical protein
MVSDDRVRPADIHAKVTWHRKRTTWRPLGASSHESKRLFGDLLRDFLLWHGRCSCLCREVDVMRRMGPMTLVAPPESGGR